MAIPCGSDTVHGPLPPCPDGLLEELDSDKDGCAEPYQLDSNNVCGNKAEPDYDKPPPKLNEEEFSCVLEGFMLLTQKSVTDLQKFKTNAKVKAYLDNYQLGKCVPCGRADQAPCTYMDFLGCMVQEGYILDPDSVRPPPPPLPPITLPFVSSQRLFGCYSLIQPSLAVSFPALFALALHVATRCHHRSGTSSLLHTEPPR